MTGPASSSIVTVAYYLSAFYLSAAELVSAASTATAAITFGNTVSCSEPLAPS